MTATQSSEVELTGDEVHNIQFKLSDTDSQNLTSQSGEMGQVEPEDVEVEGVVIPADLRIDVKSTQTRQNSDEYEPPDFLSETKPREVDTMDVKAAELKLVKAEAQVRKTESKHSKAKEIMKNKTLPFDPAKIKAAMAAKSKATKPAKAKPTGSKPTGVRKSANIKPAMMMTAGSKSTVVKKQKDMKLAATIPTANKSIVPKKPTDMKPAKVISTTSRPTVLKKSTDIKPSKRIKEASLEDMLAGTRQWIVKPNQWMIRNPDTGCWGISARNREGERTELTVAHTVHCECLDVRLMHICKHAERLVKKRRLARRSRDAFVIATKIRLELPQPIPKEIRFPRVRTQKIERWEEEIDEEKERGMVVEIHNQQLLVEKWKSLKAYKQRRIWKDW
ncbi:hypothetical protein F5B22DRAFT_350814 [Xylaria bambusicola]|uniref:uncharacterized protein n=1 Tax=Xylaria bambusicola TaxID=326684 RepID=UPI002008DC4D|nr:uncharacterized protein F5B22DRAFT_350814 [Xylaria bambusicola]KAI0525596.1 hypothetical protein F5B22DRAFT_350814 [Xylaria bambusicola]